MDELKDIESVFDNEISGLLKIRDDVECNNGILQAVDLLYQKNGHIIVSGMGKPGHVGRKIAATFSSTGTPSFFLHPAEASHGDLGEISDRDSLLVLSLSGNTHELIPMLSYANRFGVDVIGITSNPSSVLAKTASVNIIIPKITEACPHNLAPTTSTTIMMAIGDALAICLLKKKKFTKEDFKKFHPGGALGKQLLTVGDLMHVNFPKVRDIDLMKDVLIEMTQKSFGCTCVIDKKNKMIGIITDGDLRRCVTRNFLEEKASSIMTGNPKVATKEMFAQEAIKIMNNFKITSLFIVGNDNIPIGILHIHDCLRAGLA